MAETETGWGPDAGEPLWLPAPSHVARGGGWLTLPHRGTLAIASAPALRTAAARLAAEAHRRAGADWDIRAGGVPADIRVVVGSASAGGREGYRLSVTDGGVEVAAANVAGARNGLRTLTQLVRQYGLRLPTLVAEDQPDLAVRGLMLDVSRTKVPTMDTLYALLERLAELKVNHLELYMEHTFAYRDHREVWEDASPFTGAEILALDARCRDLGIDLVPNQNTLGHLTRWLRRTRYSALAECPDGSEFPWGHMGPFSLAPALPESLTFVEGLLDELLPQFTSASVNIGFDEAYDVGQGRSRALVEREGKGRVLVDFLAKVCAYVEASGRTPLYWADMVTRHHQEEIPNLPADGVALEWGYSADHDWPRFVEPLAAAGRPFYVCPGTSSWRSFVGRNEAGEANIRAAAEAARRFGAGGLLNTDWGDEGHMQPLPVSYWGYALGAALAWGPSLPADFDRAVGLHMFGDPSGEAGRVANRLGRIHARTTGERPPRAEDAFLTLALFRPGHLAELRAALAPDALERVRAEVADGVVAVSRLGLATKDAGLVRQEFSQAADALGLACDVLDTRISAAACLEHLGAWREEFRRLWVQRFRPGGLGESLAFLDPLEAALRSR
jgi:hexosaminidase